MTQINPLSGAVMQSSIVQQRAVDEKDRHLRRAQNLSRNIALQGDRLEHQVESSEAIEATHEHEEEDPRKRRKPAGHKRAGAESGPEEGDTPRLDVTA